MKIGKDQYTQIIIVNSKNEVLAAIFEDDDIKIIENDSTKIYLGNDFTFEEVNSKKGVKVVLNI